MKSVAKKRGGKRSIFEHEFSKNNRKAEYETEKLEYVIKHVYTPDFVLKKKDGTNMYIELKGVLTTDDRRKLLAVRSQHEGIDIRIVFQRAANKLHKKSKTTYSMWAEKSGFKWSEGVTIPATWKNECE